MSGITGTYGTTPVGYGTPIGAPAGMTTMSAPGMSGDSLGLSGASASPTSGQTPIAGIVDQPSVANRFKMFFVSNADRLLRVGGEGGRAGRWFLGLLAGSMPWTPAARKQEISTQVMGWVGRADLMRTGMSAWDARLIQAAGFNTSQDLRMLANPYDQAELARRLQGLAASWGASVSPPPAQIGLWVTAAQALPNRIH